MAPPGKEEQDRALKAFKKRLKIMQRDDEGSFASRSTTGGKVSGIVAVAPPPGFAPEVWEALIAAGRLRRTPGDRTFELPPRAPGT